MVQIRCSSWQRDTQKTDDALHVLTPLHFSATEALLHNRTRRAVSSSKRQWALGTRAWRRFTVILPWTTMFLGNNHGTPGSLCCLTQSSSYHYCQSHSDLFAWPFFMKCMNKCHCNESLRSVLSVHEFTDHMTRVSDVMEDSMKNRAQASDKRLVKLVFSSAAPRSEDTRSRKQNANMHSSTNVMHLESPWCIQISPDMNPVRLDCVVGTIS